MIDASGLVVAPGLVDIHVHFRGAGPRLIRKIFMRGLWQHHRWFTTVVMMANTNPTISTVETLKEVLGRLVVKISISSRLQQLQRGILMGI